MRRNLFMPPSPRFLACLCALLTLWLAGCIHRGAPRLVIARANGKLTIHGDCPSNSQSCTPFDPMDVETYLGQRYDEYRQSGFITLQPDMRIRLVAPIVRPGADPAAVQPQTSGGAGANLTAKASPDLLGYETAIYDLSNGPGGRIRIDEPEIEVKPLADGTATTLPRVDYLRTAPRQTFLRLYFQLRHSQQDHGTALLAADTIGALNEASGAFEEKPDDFCAAPLKATSCIRFPPFTAVSAEIRVHVKKDTVFLPLGSTVRDALRAAHANNPSDANVRLTRLWDLHRTPVKPARDGVSVLDVPVISQDRINY